MATIVFQGLQSCLESQVVESRTTLRLKLSSPKTPASPPQSLELALKPCEYESNNNIQRVDERISRNPDNGGAGWSFLQDLSNSSNKENVYIHPLMKRYSSKLSEKSLELCTESLGCETGSDISSENAFSFESSSSSSSFSESEESEEEEEEEVRSFEHEQEQLQEEQHQQQKQKPSQYMETKKGNCRSFPPPLTTMSRAESLQFRPHREDGRLILTAVQTPVVRSCFQAERSDGRLRLTFVNDSASNFDLDVENDDDVEEEDGEVADEEEIIEIMEKGNSNCLGGEEDCEEIEERDTEGNNLNVGGEIGKEINQRRRRIRCCKEENKGLINWEAFWVATS